MLSFNFQTKSQEFIKSIVSNLKDQFLNPENFQNVFLLVAASISGLAAVAYSRLFKLAETMVIGPLADHRELFFITTPAFFLGSWFLVYKFCPEAAGSGIPQVLAANSLDGEGPEKAMVHRFVSLRVVIVKTLSSILCVLGGGAIGREGPTLQISASIFYMIGERVKKYLPHTSSHLWIISGASAGLAAAFNTPLGGIIYAIEEMGAAHFHRIRTILLSAILTAGLISLWLSGNYLYLGFPEIPSESMSLLPMALVIGIVTGLAGSVFSSFLFTLVRLRKTLKKPSSLALVALSCGLFMASFVFIDTTHSGSGVALLNEMLFHGLTPDLKMVLGRFFGTVVSYISGAAGGIFSPSLAIGGCLGGFIANLVGSTDQNLFIILGMIGFLTGVTRTPFTSFILVVEMTNRHSAIFHMMVAALVAQVFARLLHHGSFYERMKEIYLKDSRGAGL